MDLTSKKWIRPPYISGFDLLIKVEKKVWTCEGRIDLWRSNLTFRPFDLHLHPWRQIRQARFTSGKYCKKKIPKTISKGSPEIMWINLIILTPAMGLGKEGF